MTPRAGTALGIPYVSFHTEDVEALRKVALARNQVQRGAGQRDGLVDRQVGSVGVDLIGVLAEAAVAVHYGHPWDGAIFNHASWLAWRKTGHDVGPLEVRGTNNRNGRLIVQPDDQDTAPFVLVEMVEQPSGGVCAILRGWSYGHEVKREENWRAGWPKPTYAIDQDQLRPMAALTLTKGSKDAHSTTQCA